MRKEEVRGLIVYTILIAVALIVGLTAVKDAMYQYYSAGLNQLVFVLIVLILAYFVNTIGHELLHALGAVIGGYKVVSINILGFCFENEKGKTSFHFKDFDGLTGETKIAPGKKEKKNLNLFVWCPIFGFAAEIASCIVIMSIIKDNPKSNAQWLVVAAVLFILVSSLMAFYDLVPIRLDCKTDGYRMRLFANKINVEAYNAMLEIEDKQRNGEKIEKVPVFEEITEFTAELNMVAAYYYLGKENFKKAEEIINKLIENKNKLSYTDVNRLLAQKLYLTILTKPIGEAKNLYDEIATTEIRRFISNDISMESIRAYILIAGMIEESEGEVKYAISKIEKAKKRSLKSQIEVEEKLVNKSIDYVYEKHPKWEKENAE